MTAPRPGTPTTGDADPGARRPGMLVAAAVLAVVVVGLVLLFGVVRPPQLATIDDAPAAVPPARLVTFGWDEDGDCLTVVEVDGTTRRPWCSDDHAELGGWGEDGVIVRVHGPRREVEQVIDPGDGEVVVSRAVPDAGATSAHGSDVVTSSRPDAGDVLEVRLEDGTLLWRVDAPERYEVTEGRVSPDGSVVTLLDSADRLLVVPADGSAEPRIWTDDVSPWSDVAWEGSVPRS